MAGLNETLQTVLANIMTILGNSSLDEPFIELVLKRLESLGYTIQDGDGWMIGFSVQKVENHIKNSCNTSSVPDGLKYTAVDMVCGEFLFALKQTGKLNETFDLDAAVKQVQAGDTNVTFAIGDGSNTPEQRLNNLLAYLMTKGEGDFVCYRKIKW
nr:hypothetical protein [uncultured Anaerocolumna sp.]